MSYSFTRTREQLMAMILRKLGVLSTGETASSEDADIVYEAIDIKLKELHSLGIFWRKVAAVPLSFTLSANTTAGSASADVLFPIAMAAVDSSQDEPIEIISKLKYSKIENKGETGVPTMAVHNGSSSFVFWPVPISNTTIKLTYEKIIDDTAAATQPDVEVSMLGCLRDIVAYELRDDFGISETTIARWARDKVLAENRIRNLNAPRVDNAPVEMVNY